jgi:Sugar (and other) transporter
MLDALEKSLWKHNVANKYEKRALLTIVNLVAGLSIFFFGYDQGVMGGVNTNRNYARLMKIGHFSTEDNIVVVDHELQQGGIVSHPLTLADNIQNADYSADRSLLPSWHSSWLPYRWLVWRQIWPHQDHVCFRLLDYLWCCLTMFCSKPRMDVLLYVTDTTTLPHTDKNLARILTGIGTGGLNAITPVWATETASHTSRGAFVSIEFTLNIFGVVVAYWLELWVFSNLPKGLSIRTNSDSQRHVEIL